MAIPCFIKHIPQCLQLLDALEYQTRRPDEVVVSCSSTDEFPHKEYSYPIKILVTEKKQNTSTNRNCAARELQTDIICFFDADDEMHPQRLEVIERSFQSVRDIQSTNGVTGDIQSTNGVTGDIQSVRDQSVRDQSVREAPTTDIILHSFFEESERDRPYPLIDLSNYSMIRNQLSQAPSGCITLDNVQRIHHGQVSVTKEIFQQVQFPEEREYEIREDCVFCYRVFSLPNIRSVYLPDPLSKYSPSWTCVTEYHN